MRYLCVLSVLVAVSVPSLANPSPTECLILWTSQLVRRVKEFVFYIPTTYYHPPPPVYTGVTFFGGGSGAFPGGRPFTPNPGGSKPSTPKPGGRKPPPLRPVGPKPPVIKPGGSEKPKSTRPTTRRPPGTKPTTPRTTTTMYTTSTTTTETTPVRDIVEEVEEQTTVRPFYNMLCGVCPPMKQCLCPGVHF